MSKKKSAKESRIMTLMDGWKNILTGLGIKNQDKRIGASLCWERMPEVDADDFYAASDVSKTIVDELPFDAMREGYELTFKGVSDEQKRALLIEQERLQVNAKMNESWRWGRLYGGGGIVIIPANVEELSKPLVAVEQIKNLLVLTSHELQGNSIDPDVRSPNFGYPTQYSIVPRGTVANGVAGLPVHHSRVIRFDGNQLPRNLFVRNQYWHDSVLNAAKDAIRDYETSMASLAATLQDFSVATYKISNLSGMLAQGDDAAVIARMQLINVTRSIARAVVLDSENESFEYQTRALTGISDAVRTIAGRLVVASKMPHTKILGESPDGSNATGNSTTTQWYDYVKHQQTSYLKPRLLALWRLILSQRQGPFAGKVPQDLDATFNPLWQLSEEEETNVRKTQAEVDGAYLDRGVLDPEEVRKSRFGSGKYSSETTIDLNRTPEPVSNGNDPSSNPSQAGS